MTPKFTDCICGEKTYRLCYDFNLIADTEGLIGFNLLQPLRHVDAMSAGQMRGLLYALLRTAQPKMSIADAGALLNEDSATVTAAMWKALDIKSAENSLMVELEKMAIENPMELVALLSRLNLPAETKE